MAEFVPYAEIEATERAICVAPLAGVLQKIVAEYWGGRVMFDRMVRLIKEDMLVVSANTVKNLHGHKVAISTGWRFTAVGRYMTLWSADAWSWSPHALSMDLVQFWDWATCYVDDTNIRRVIQETSDARVTIPIVRRQICRMCIEAGNHIS